MLRQQQFNFYKIDSLTVCLQLTFICAIFVPMYKKQTTNFTHSLLSCVLTVCKRIHKKLKNKI